MNDLLLESCIKKMQAFFIPFSDFQVEPKFARILRLVRMVVWKSER
jgi:hypothetical protein